ncbi:hypothetical protein BCR35DRAFT_21752 [Leucosporidium creatinivorum]|uniref:ATP-dependent DNA helicase n=1 Tax=Leucosporidium creatinivorum TaxID=106004 RepID=A0A1Y2FYA8_9BASI|nr:hypothetical protein BCR35DRAFT_21752 [Leucosporidium creatinivorum]
MSSDGFEFDDSAFDQLDQIEHTYTTFGQLPPRTTVNKPGLQQRDLFGGFVAEKEKPPPQPSAGPSRGGGGAPPSGMKETAAKVKVVKRWDPASFAKHGWSKKTAAAKKALARGGKGGKGKGKKKAYGSDEDEWDDEDVLEDDGGSDSDDGFLVDPTYDPHAPLLPIKWPPDPEASKTWVYPSSPDKPMRVYQYNIVHVALFENTLVSLPTGLGKTFIAAVVMLNYYRWYPKSKIIFLAPSRPLVAQQVTACHYIAGIPQEHCVELTGHTTPKLRQVGWSTKRVIYCTPQTLENDLAKGRVDPRDISCLVVDEAHRASGDYAYCGVVRYMMSRNQHFRILALTATPGARGEAVQDVIDNLHIGNVQVRTDQSLDIRQYIHHKSYDLNVLPLGDVLSSIRDRWGRLMDVYIKPLLAARCIFEGRAEFLTPYVCQMAFGKIKALPGGNSANGGLYPMAKNLGPMARAMEYLIVQSLTEFDNCVKDIESTGSKTLTNKSEFKEIVREVRTLRARAGYVGHPKMEKLRSMCLDHFAAAEKDIDEATGEPRQTRVMVFCNYRAVVEEIVDCLNTQRPLIKATPFVGQATSKGSRGMSQKDQIETIKKFKKGTFNVMVASSIGEEGLDIGEIDLIVCYEANKSPIRMLQRVGRTGRARDGHIIVLMTEGREERNWDKAKDSYNEVQNALISNKVFELYADGDRMLPKHINPEVDKIAITAKPINLATMTMNGQIGLERQISREEKKKAKKKPSRDPKLNMPNDAFDGFRTAGQLAAAEAKTRKKAAPSPGQLLRERKKAVYLTEEQEEHMRNRWYHSNDQLVKPVVFDTFSLPFERGQSGSALTIPRHSDRHADLLSSFAKMEKLDDSHPDALDSWHEKMSAAFNKDLLCIWDPTKRRRANPSHPSLRRPLASPEMPSSFAIPPPATRTVPKALFLDLSSPEPSPPLARPRLPPRISPPPLQAQRSISSPLEELPPPQRPIARAGSTAAPRPPPPPQAKPPPPPPKPRAAPPPPSAAVPRPRPVPPPSHTIYHQEQIDSQPHGSLDLFGVLSSEPDIPAAAAQPSLPRPSKASTSYSDMLDGAGEDDDLLVSDSELLKGAVVKGKSKSPVKAQPQAQPEEIVLDSEEEEEEQTMLPRVLTQVSREEPLPWSPTPPKAARHEASAEVVPDSDEEMVDFLLPRQSARTRSTTPEKVDPPSAHEDPVDDLDEFSFFDLPDEAMEAALDIAPAKVIQARLPPPPAALVHTSSPTAVVLEVDLDEDDSALMPPPPPSVSKRRPPPQPQYRPRPHHHRIPDSDSSEPPESASRPPAAVDSRPPQDIDASFDNSPVVAAGRRGPVKRTAVIGSSSSQVEPAPRAGPCSTSAFRFAADLSDSPAQPKPKQLNRLRRGRQVVEDDEEEEDNDEVQIEEEYDEPLHSAPRPKPKPKKAKRIKLTEKAAARSNLFDMEAVNSSADEPEPSSEAYATEDSDDRRFVASENGDLEEAGSLRWEWSE